MTRRELKRSALNGVLLVVFLGLACTRDSAPPPTQCRAIEARSIKSSMNAFAASAVAAEEPLISAARDPEEPWHLALRRQFDRSIRRADTDIAAPVAITVAAAAKYYRSDLDISTLPEWTMGEETLTQALHHVRDERMYVDDSRPDFLRRALWLYPYNACFVRAAHIAQGMERLGLLRPGKVFVFGDLRLKTPYDKRGRVLWSYHVAAAYRVGNRVVILDAAIDHMKPIPLEVWLAAITDDITKVKVSVCDTFSYSPINPCQGGLKRQERSTVNHLKSYLPDEWRRLQNLNMDPVKLLGTEPPWLAPGATPYPEPTPLPTPPPTPVPTPGPISSPIPDEPMPTPPVSTPTPIEETRPQPPPLQPPRSPSSPQPLPVASPTQGTESEEDPGDAIDPCP